MRLDERFHERITADMERRRIREAAEDAALTGLRIASIERDFSGFIKRLVFDNGTALRATGDDSESWIEVE